MQKPTQAKSKKSTVIDFNQNPYNGRRVLKKRKFNLKAPALLLLGIMGFSIYSLSGEMIKMYEMRSEVKKIEKKINQLKIENKKLKKKIDYINSEAYVERVAREELGLVKPGEKIIIEASPEKIPSSQKNVNPGSVPP